MICEIYHKNNMIITTFGLILYILKCVGRLRILFQTHTSWDTESTYTLESSYKILYETTKLGFLTDEHKELHGPWNLNPVDSGFSPLLQGTISCVLLKLNYEPFRMAEQHHIYRCYSSNDLHLPELYQNPPTTTTFNTLVIGVLNLQYGDQIKDHFF